MTCLALYLPPPSTPPSTLFYTFPLSPPPSPYTFPSLYFPYLLALYLPPLRLSSLPRPPPPPPNFPLAPSPPSPLPFILDLPLVTLEAILVCFIIVHHCKPWLSELQIMAFLVCIQCAVSLLLTHSNNKGIRISEDTL